MVIVATETPDDNNNATATDIVITETAAPTVTPDPPTPAASPTPDPFPTATIGQIQVAEQPFERGRMFWVQPKRQIWVMEITEEGRGIWTIYNDTFEEGQPEFDPELTPPADNLYQPERGFGKLWRENPEVREALGWAITPDEFGYISRYEYHPGGTINENGEYVMGPGYHILFSLYEEAFRFNEADRTWQLGRGE
ncbi:MAG: hypothetical protein DIU68_008245 [Chloroflexota bacterium]